MCLKLKKEYFQGKYKEDSYKAKKGEEYSYYIFVKCGYCSQCIAEKSNNWVIRNTYEAQDHKKACFITLTYKDNPYFLIKKDLQDFLKRLRRYIEYHKINNGEKIKFFACGEYGERHNRPHYHIIIYNFEDENKKFLRLSQKGNIGYYSEIIEKLWGKGLTMYQDFDTHEIPYIALYNMPKMELAREYKTSRNNLKKHLEELKEKEKDFRRKKRVNTIEYAGYLNRIKQTEKMIKELQKKHAEYITVKEFNTWSKALGWNAFYRNYNKNNYNFIEYIEDKEFYTPTPWVKKLANKYGDSNAIKEMLRREAELTAIGTLEEEQAKANNRKLDKRKNEIIDFHEKEPNNDF